MTPLRTMTLAAAAAGLVLAGVAGASAQPSGKVHVYELGRTLSALQTRIINGDERAHASQRSLLDYMAKVIRAAPDTDWQDARNVRVVITFVLGGGDPRVVRPIVDKLVGQDATIRVAQAAVLYAEGKLREARTVFEKVEARTLETSLAGHVALIKGVLLDGVNRVAALEQLDDARLLSPGTIVEEAALRRALPMVGSTGDFDKFSYLMSRYLRRFGDSIYAPGLAPQLATVVTAPGFMNSPERYAELDRVISLAHPALAHEIYLAMAQRGVGEADADLVKFAAARAEKLSQRDSIEGERAKLYGAAVMVVSEEMDEGLERLMNIRKSRLGRTDVEIVDAAFRVATAVRQPPGEVDTDAGRDDLDQSKLEAFAANQDNETVARASSTLEMIDTMLQEID